MERIIYSFPYSSLCCACFSKSTQSLQSFNRSYKNEKKEWMQLWCCISNNLFVVFATCLPSISGSPSHPSLLILCGFSVLLIFPFLRFISSPAFRVCHVSPLEMIRHISLLSFSLFWLSLSLSWFIFGGLPLILLISFESLYIIRSETLPPLTDKVKGKWW